MTKTNGTTTDTKLKIFKPTTVPDPKTHATCLTGPSKSGWKIAFYLPILMDDEASIKRYATNAAGMVRKGLNVLGHGIKSTDLWAEKNALKPDGTPTIQTILAIQKMGELLVVGRSGPTKQEEIRQQAKEEAVSDMLSDLGMGSVEELKIAIAKKKAQK